MPPDCLMAQGLLEQLDHTGGRGRHIESQRLGDLARHLVASALRVELDVAAEEVVGVHPSRAPGSDP